MASEQAEIFDVLRHLSGFCEAFIVLTTVAVALRLYTRGFILRQLALDDYAMIIAYICYILTAALTLALCATIRDLFGGKSVDIDSMLLLVKINTASYILTMVMIKVSLGYFFLRIFSIQIVQRSIIWFVVSTSVLFGLVYFLMSMITCGLTASFLGTPCGASHAYIVVSKAWSWYDGATDMVFSLLSAHFLWNANMSRTTKSYTSLVLGMGTAGGVISMVRIIVLSKISNGPGSYAQGLRSGYWTQIETGMGIIAASLACLRPLLTLFREKMTSGLSGKTGKTITGRDVTAASGLAISNKMRTMDKDNEVSHLENHSRIHNEDVDRDNDSSELAHGKIGTMVTVGVVSEPKTR